MKHSIFLTEDQIKEISQADATSILGSKSKRTHKRREIVSNNDLEELNKQLSSLKNSVAEKLKRWLQSSLGQDVSIESQPLQFSL